MTFVRRASGVTTALIPSLRISTPAVGVIRKLAPDYNPLNHWFVRYFMASLLRKMPEIRPEITRATEDNLPNSFLRPQWPADISRECPHCGKELHPQINLSYGYGRSGRICKSISWWITLPWIPTVIFIVLPLLMKLPGGNGAAFALCILFVVPAVFFALLAPLFPRSRRVRCYPCQYSKDYSVSAK